MGNLLPEPESQIESKPDSQIESKPDSKSDSQIESKTNSKPESKSDLKDLNSKERVLAFGKYQERYDFEVQKEIKSWGGFYKEEQKVVKEVKERVVKLSTLKDLKFEFLKYENSNYIFNISPLNKKVFFEMNQSEAETVFEKDLKPEIGFDFDGNEINYAILNGKKGEFELISKSAPETPRDIEPDLEVARETSSPVSVKCKNVISMQTLLRVKSLGTRELEFSTSESISPKSSCKSVELQKVDSKTFRLKFKKDIKEYYDNWSWKVKEKKSKGSSNNIVIEFQ
jgi:hypothetical protein